MPKFQYQYNDNRILCFVTNTGVRLLLTLKYKWSITNHAYTSSHRLDLEDSAGCCKTLQQMEPNSNTESKISVFWKKSHLIKWLGCHHCFLDPACLASSGVTMTTFFFSAASSSRLAFISARSSVNFCSFSFLSFSRRSRRDSITSLAQTSRGAFSTYSLPVKCWKQKQMNQT